MAFNPLSEKEEYLGKEIVDASFKVHKQLGPGLLESIYENCLCYELEKKHLGVKKQVSVPVKYDGVIFEDALRLDIIVEDLVICEIKAVEKHNQLWQAQLLSYLKLTNNRLGYLINFNTSLIKNGIKRIVL